MPRPLWKGAVTFGLVSVPVNLYPATRREAEFSFRLLHRKDLAPIDYRRYCSTEDVEVAWKDIVKGYEHAKGQFVVVSDADFARARVPGTQTLEIRDFVPAHQIDPAYGASPYWLEPAPAGRKAYALLRDALAETGRVAIGSFVLRQREHLAALRPSGQALQLTTLRFADELRSPSDLDLPRSGGDKRERALALQLIETLASDWEPAKYRDSYREVLRDLIERKVEGEEIAAPAERQPRPKVVDLMEALRASLEQPVGKREAPGRKAARRRTAGRRRAA
jgi:DNA end-binding protein Ku